MPKKLDLSFSSNVQRLSCRQWAATALLVAAMLFILPAIWQHFQRFGPTPDYRIPHEISNDYWTFRKWCMVAAEKHDVLIIGDSVVWGEYVRPGETLSAHLNRASGEEMAFANLGLGGSHPLALGGLVRNYAPFRNRRVILHLNPLWMSTPRTELRGKEEEGNTGRVNHPRLIPQFDRRITAYDAGYDTRFAVHVRNRIPMLQLVAHWQHVSFNSTTLPAWAMSNPYSNPAHHISMSIPSLSDSPGSQPVDWQKVGLSQQDYSWTPPDESLQWEAFRNVAEALLRRGNSLFVIFGPLNLHMLTDSSRQRYQQVEGEWIQWLEEREIPYARPDILPSNLYCDASHPASEGYRILAHDLLRNANFTDWLR